MEWKWNSLASLVCAPLGRLSASDLAFSTVMTSEVDRLAPLLGLLRFFIQAAGHPLDS